MSDPVDASAYNVVGEPYGKAVAILKNMGVKATFGGSRGSALPQAECLVDQQKVNSNGRMVLMLDCTKEAAEARRRGGAGRWPEGGLQRRHHGDRDAGGPAARHAHPGGLTSDAHQMMRSASPGRQTSNSLSICDDQSGSENGHHTPSLPRTPLGSSIAAVMALISSWSSLTGATRLSESSLTS